MVLTYRFDPIVLLKNLLSCSALYKSYTPIVNRTTIRLLKYGGWGRKRETESCSQQTPSRGDLYFICLNHHCEFQMIPMEIKAGYWSLEFSLSHKTTHWIDIFFLMNILNWRVVVVSHGYKLANLTRMPRNVFSLPELTDKGGVICFTAALNWPYPCVRQSLTTAEHLRKTKQLLGKKLNF
jgi:hypothetical protein